MVIDVEHRGSLQPCDTRPIESAALHDERGVDRVNTRRHAKLIDPGERLKKVRRGRVEHHLGLFAKGTQRKRGR